MKKIKYKKKGAILPFATTVVLLLLVVAVMIAALFFYVINWGKTINPTFTVSEAAKPYFIADAFEYLKLKDRQFLEHALETIATGSMGASNSEPVIKDIHGFLDKYKLDFYSVAITKNDGVLARIDSVPYKCGDSQQGICMSPLSQPIGGGGAIPLGCGNGRKEISDTGDVCGFGEICCADNKNSNGQWLDSGGNAVASCGTARNRIGVCDLSRNGECSTGRVAIPQESGQCSAGLLCCAPLSARALQSIGQVRGAEIPVLYKGGILGFIEVNTA